ncbi:MAG TPA: hydantoinase B/oxoprolinase family protein, partial [Planctomycetaceae bacterium]|nr:hydantoinase B/oxoprolinase family protein [Planctomycetaceae bacterium]
QAAVMYVMRCLIDEDIPLNSGVMVPVELRVPECLLNPPRLESPEKCAAVVGGNVETSQRIVDVLIGALGLAAASQGTMNNFSFGNQRFGYYETICGGAGATSRADGSDAVHTHMTNTRLTDVEVIESRYPVRVLEFSIRRGSGGIGKYRGGDGVIRRIRFLESLDVSLLTERRGKFTPYGLQGGQPGAIGENRIEQAADGVSRILPGKVQLQVRPGDVVTIATPGGGGWGESRVEEGTDRPKREN